MMPTASEAIFQVTHAHIVCLADYACSVIQPTPKTFFQYRWDTNVYVFVYAKLRSLSKQRLWRLHSIHSHSDARHAFECSAHKHVSTRFECFLCECAFRSMEEPKSVHFALSCIIQSLQLPTGVAAECHSNAHCRVRARTRTERERERERERVVMPFEG
jgi:hypothetical protein